MAYQLKRLQQRHYLIMEKLLLGKTQKEIAREIGYSEYGLSNAINCPLFQAELNRRRVEQNSYIDVSEVEQRTNWTVSCICLDCCKKDFKSMQKLYCDCGGLIIVVYAKGQDEEDRDRVANEVSHLENDLEHRKWYKQKYLKLAESPEILVSRPV